MPSRLRENGVALLKGIIDEELVRRWYSITDQCYQNLDAIGEKHGPQAIQHNLPAGQKYVPAASSFTLEVAFADKEWREILQAVAAGPARDLIEDGLGGRAVCDLDQAWVRRQFAPMLHPAQHAPHSWHQDGALGSSFAFVESGADDANALLPLITCWIPLVPCGTDAPGLELIALRGKELIPPRCLVDDFLRSKYPPDAFLRPVMEPGDVLVFHGDVLHRTHVTTAMQSYRTSIELRFFPAARIPPRLAGDRFVPLA